MFCHLECPQVHEHLLADPPKMMEAEIVVKQATMDQVDSLSTIVARSFHPVNPYIARCMPDTPMVRQWWRRLFSKSIQDDYCYVFTAVDKSNGEVVGVLNLRFQGPDQKGAGMWTEFDITPDHDAESYRAIIDAMAEAREKHMSGNAHLLLELFGVDHAYKGRKIGHRLLRAACDLATDGGYEIFVQANSSALAFYQRQDFQLRETKIMPGEEAYEEHMLVHPAH